MNIVVAFKVVPDDQDIAINADGSLDYSRAHQVVSSYDLNAIEAAAQLAAQAEESTVVAISVAAEAANDGKLRKNVLARGADELIMIADDAAKNADTYATAQALKELVVRVEDKLGSWDVIVCGDGSADDYAQQVDVQLAAALGVPVVNGVVSVVAHDGLLEVERILEDCVERLSVPLPAVISVSPDIALPRIPGMREILSAGKKPATVIDCSDVQMQDDNVEVLQVKAPEQRERACVVYELANDGDLDAFVQAVVTSIR